MAYEKENDVWGSIPEFGAIFMCNVATKKECLRLELFGLPSGQANFVKRVKAGMVLFLFEYEMRELYGVFQACSDGALNIVPHAFSSSGNQFPAQVRFTQIWYCSPLSEYEFRDAIKENYFSNKKFNFGLSEDQVHRLLWLFNSRKLENKPPQRQIARQTSKPIEKDKRTASNDRFFWRNRTETLVEEDGPVSAINRKYLGKSSCNTGRLDDVKFMENDGIENEQNVDNYLGHDILTEHPGCKRRDDDGRFSMQDRKPSIIDQQGKLLCNSRRVAEDRQFILGDRDETKGFIDSSVGQIVSPKYPGVSLAKVRSTNDDGRFPIRDVVGKRSIVDNCFAFVSPTDHHENPVTKARRRATDDRRFFMGFREENDRNSDHFSVNPLGKLSRTSDAGNYFMNDRMKIEHPVESGIKPNISAKYFENPLGKVNKDTDGGKFFMSDRVEIPTQHFADHLDYVRRENDRDRISTNISMDNKHNVDNGFGPITSTVHSDYPSDKIRRVADEGMFLKVGKLDNAYNTENRFGSPLSARYTDFCQSRQNPSFYSSKPMLESDYSLHQVQHKPSSAFPHSMEQKILSSPTSHDAISTRAFPCDPEVPSIQHRHSLFVGGDRTSHLVHDFPPQHSSVGNFFASTKRSSPFHLDAEGLNQHLDVASGCMKKIPLPTLPNNSYSRTSKYLSSAGYYGKMEAEAPGREVYEDTLFSESSLASLPLSNSENYEGQNMGPFLEFDKRGVALKGRYKHKVPQHENNQAFSVNDVPSSNKNVGHLQSGSPREKSSNHYQNSKGMASDSKCVRTSVFTRLTLAPEVVHVQENATYTGYDECDMDASVDQVMDVLNRTLNHRSTKVRRFPSVRQHDDKIPRTKKRDMIFNQIECDKLATMTEKIMNDAEQVIEENCDRLAVETRVVDFKRRSETKKNQDGIKTKNPAETGAHEANGSVQKPQCEGKQHKRKKLVRPVFGKKEQLSEGLSKDELSNLQLLPHESSGKDNTGSCDDAIISQENDNRSSSNAQLIQATFPTGCQGNNDNNVQLNSDCSEKIDKNRGLVRPVFGRKVSLHESTINNSTSNLHLASHEGSNAKENNFGICDEMVRSCKNDNISAQNVGFMHVTNIAAICDAVSNAADSSDRAEEGKKELLEDGTGDPPA